MNLDVKVDEDNNTINNGIVKVLGDVEGETKVIVKFIGDESKLDVSKEISSLFVEALNDNVVDTEAKFVISRFYGRAVEPYNEWWIKENIKGEESGNSWYLGTGEDLSNKPEEDNNGDDNTGDDVIGGDDNTGDDNTGDDVIGGDDNTGDDVIGGDDNSGDDVIGGDDNTGDDVIGGDDNTGDDVIGGDDNTGDDVIGGDDNTGDDVIGGDDNTGDDVIGGDDDIPNFEDDSGNDGNEENSKPSIDINNNGNAVYYPEIAAYYGVMSAVVEQNRRITNSINRGILSRDERVCCGTELTPYKNAWIDVAYENSHIKSPSHIEAEISGATIGIDLMRDYTDRVGVFGVYRDGHYDLSGNGDFRGNSGSTIDDKSWLGGLYWRYDDNYDRVLATLFAGKHSIDVVTDDAIINTDTKATQIGASIEMSRHFEMNENIDMTPVVSAYYSYYDVENFRDKVGKGVRFDDMQYVETKAGVKVEYLACRKGCANRLYVEPSIIKTFVKGGDVKITNLDNVKGVKEDLLARIEMGGEFTFNEELSGYLSYGYTFSNKYNAYDLLFGINWEF